MINLLDNTQNKPSIIQRKSWFEINDDACRMYSTNSQIKLRTTLLKSNLCDYSDAYILVTKTILVANNAVVDDDANNENIKVIFKSCAPFTDYNPIR